MKSNPLFILFALIALCSLPFSAHSMDLRNRLGIGFSQQLKNNLPAISFKLQKGPAWALGGLFNYSSSSSRGGYGAGLKVYRIIFDEPLLNFYTALTGALVNEVISGSSHTGFEIDGALGTEFHFKGLESLGFSVEFGLTLSKLQDGFVFEIMGKSLIAAAVHFYL